MVTFLQTKWSPPGFAPVVYTFALFSGLGQIIVGIVEVSPGAHGRGGVRELLGPPCPRFTFV